MTEKSLACLKLASGFIFDYSNLYGRGKITQTDILELSDQIYSAHQAVEHLRSTGDVRGHLSQDGMPEKVLFTQLPYVTEGNLNSPASIQRLKDFGRSLKDHVDAVVSFGIGGSYLGNRVLFEVHCGQFWNYQDREARNGYPKLFFSGNNIDPRCTYELVEHLLADARNKASAGDKYNVTLIVISKSGSTLDTMATFMVVYDALKSFNSLINLQVVAVTDPGTGEKETLLHKLAVEKRWLTFSVPAGVGGRFSVFSEVGLITAACIGFDIDAFLAGARGMDQACRTIVFWRNPAQLNAVLKYIAAAKYGLDIEVFMPYGDYLKAVAEWYVQLLAESLGKRNDRDGKEVFYGRTPVVAVGSTDMHAQTQLHQDGKRNKIVQFVKVDHWDSDPVIPDAFPNFKQLSEMSSIYLSQALDAACEANAQALSSDNRFNATFILPRLNAYHLGELLYLLALSVAYEGELANVNAFDQPGVESYKRLMGPLLAGLKRNQFKNVL